MESTVFEEEREIESLYIIIYYMLSPFDYSKRKSNNKFICHHYGKKKTLLTCHQIIFNQFPITVLTKKSSGDIITRKVMNYFSNLPLL